MSWNEIGEIIRAPIDNRDQVVRGVSPWFATPVTPWVRREQRHPVAAVLTGGAGSASPGAARPVSAAVAQYSMQALVPLAAVLVTTLRLEDRAALLTDASRQG